MGLRVLDCTLRDGGYINNWEFGRRAMAAILEKLSAGGIDIIECGFLTARPRGEDCSLFQSPQEILPLLPKGERRSLFVAMIALGKEELPPQALPPCGREGIGGIRLTFHREEADKAFAWAGAIGEKGYKVFLQPVGTAFYSDLELLRLVERVNRQPPFAFYIVDTLGSMYPNQVSRQFHLIDANMEPGIQLGFHGHNNLQLAFSNAQMLAGMQTKRDVILDSSVFGMGRGAGNLPTELITGYINRNLRSRYQVGEVLDVYDEYIAPLRREYEWGYTMAYHLAAVHACHPSYAAYLLNKQTLTMQDMERILGEIPAQSRVEYQRDLARELYHRYQARAVDDSAAVEELRELLAGRELLVLAPGESLSRHRGRVMDFIRERRPLVAAVNFADACFGVELCFVSSHKRLDIAGEQLRALPGVRRVYTSNLAGQGEEDCLYVDYARCLNPDPMVGDNAGLMFLKLVERCGVRQATLAGFDGFSRGYYTREAALPVDRAEGLERQRRMREQLSRLGLELRFLTPSAYEEKGETP